MSFSLFHQWERQTERDAQEDVARYPSSWPTIFEEFKKSLAIAKERLLPVLQNTGLMLQGLRAQVVKALTKAPPLPVLLNQQRRGWFEIIALCLPLLIGGFALIRYAIEPWRMGAMTSIVAFAVALASTAAMHFFLSTLMAREWVNFAIALVALILIITVVACLGVLRAERVIETASTSALPVEISAGLEAATPTPTGTDYVTRTRSYLILCFSFLSLALELTAGVIFHHAYERIASPFIGLYQSLEQINKQLGEVYGEIKMVEHIEESLSAAYLRGAFRALSAPNTTSFEKKAAIGVGIGLIIVLLLILAGTAHAAPQTVVMLDLSTSSDITGPNQENGFADNCKGVGQILQTLPSCERVTVFGITAKSFEAPDLLLEARIDCDQGFFGERLRAAHKALTAAWAKRSATLKPNAPQTDIIGALFLAQNLFKNNPQDHHELVIFSDMRNCTSTLNLEATPLESKRLIAGLTRKALIPELSGVTISIFGVHAAGKDVTYWRRLEEFWTEYFQRSGANLKLFSQRRNQ